jgi:alpha-beta hydrolase superfamily lysophospholipase
MSEAPPAGMRELVFTADDGVEVCYRHWDPNGAARAIVLIVHGASEHSGRYARFAETLRHTGCAVYALDLRGHGRTAASTGFGVMGAGGIDGLLADVHQLADRARAECSSLPVVLFGHSMGSLIAQAYVERFGDALSGYVLSGSGGVPAEDFVEMSTMMRAAVDAGLADEPVDMLGDFNVNFEPARTRFDWLSRDPDEVDRYIADPWCGDNAPLTYGFVAALVEAAGAVMEPDAIARIPQHLPVLLITGVADPASNGASQVRELERRLRDAGLDVTAEYYSDARHELLNETNRDEVHADVIAWLNRVTTVT